MPNHLATPARANQHYFSNQNKAGSQLKMLLSVNSNQSKKNANTLGLMQKADKECLINGSELRYSTATLNNIILQVRQLKINSLFFFFKTQVITQKES